MRSSIAELMSSPIYSSPGSGSDPCEDRILRVLRHIGTDRLTLAKQRPTSAAPMPEEPPAMIGVHCSIHRAGIQASSRASDLDRAGGMAVFPEARVLHEVGIAPCLSDIEWLAILDPRGQPLDNPMGLRRRHRFQNDEHRVTGQDGDVAAGQELPHLRDATLGAPYFARNAAKLFDAAKRKDDASRANRSCAPCIRSRPV